MNWKDGDKKDENGQAKDKIICLGLFLNSLGKGLTDKCCVHLEIAVYSWIGSVAQAPPGLVRREDS
jgi:hypothetical protein